VFVCVQVKPSCDGGGVAVDHDQSDVVDMQLLDVIDVDATCTVDCEVCFSFYFFLLGLLCQVSSKDKKALTPQNIVFSFFLLFNL
jgi:hypothetical protein